MTKAQLNISVLSTICQHVADMDRQADFDRRLADVSAAKLEKHGAAAAPIIDAAGAAARTRGGRGLVDCPLLRVCGFRGVAGECPALPYALAPRLSRGSGLRQPVRRVRRVSSTVRAGAHVRSDGLARGHRRRCSRVGVGLSPA